jgi:acyl carrier protein
MTFDEIRHDVRAFLIDQYFFGKEVQLNNTDSFMDRGLLDSTGILELVSFLENTYGFRIEDNELIPDNLDSVDAVTDFVARKCAGPLAAGQVAKEHGMQGLLA